MMKKLAILGSTGSIGRSTLDVVSRHPDRFHVVALGAGTNISLLAEQIITFRPEVVSVADASDMTTLRSYLKNISVDIVAGDEGACQLARASSVDCVVSAMVGACGLASTLAAAESGKRVALANKESLVAGGELVMKKVSEHKAEILPIDSEHSAIFQSLVGHRLQDVAKIFLTASGGPFRSTSAEALKKVTVDEALAHPTWTMGKKITIDSATLMNKGLEVIEAHWLFGVPAKIIEVVVHPQSIIHSMVEYVDGSVVAQLGIPDMRTPIAYALAYPERVASGVQPLRPQQLSSLTFESVDRERFPCLSLAYDALAAGGSMPAVLNAANEVVVSAFLDRRIPFLSIASVIAHVLEKHDPQRIDSLEAILQVDQWARRVAHTEITKGHL